MGHFFTFLFYCVGDMDALPAEMWTEILFHLCGRCFPLPTRLDPARDGQLAATLAALPGKDKRLLRAKAAKPLLTGIRASLRVLIAVRSVSRGMNKLVIDLMARVYPVLYTVFAHVARRANLPHCTALRLPAAGVGALNGARRWYWAAARLLAWPTPTPTEEVTLVPRRTMEPVPWAPDKWFAPLDVGDTCIVRLPNGSYGTERIQHQLTMDNVTKQLLPPYVMRAGPHVPFILDTFKFGFSSRSPLRPLLLTEQPLPYELVKTEFVREQRLNAMQGYLWQELEDWGPEPPTRKRKRKRTGDEDAAPPLTPEQRAAQLLKRARYE
jgi:hypothetical protein